MLNLVKKRLFSLPNTSSGIGSTLWAGVAGICAVCFGFTGNDNADKFINTVQQIADKAYVAMGMTAGGELGLTGSAVWAITLLLAAGAGAIIAGGVGALAYNSLFNFPSRAERVLHKALGDHWDLKIDRKRQLVEADVGLTSGQNLHLTYDPVGNKARATLTHDEPDGTYTTFTRIGGIPVGGIRVPITQTRYKTVVDESHTNGNLPPVAAEAIKNLRRTFARHRRSFPNPYPLDSL